MTLQDNADQLAADAQALAAEIATTPAVDEARIVALELQAAEVAVELDSLAFDLQALSLRLTPSLPPPAPTVPSPVPVPQSAVQRDPSGPVWAWRESF
jgi:hypothetical protein